MAYQNVGTPRFYIDNLSWGISNGLNAGLGFANGNQWILNGSGATGAYNNDFSYLNPSKINTLSHPAGGNPNLYLNQGHIMPVNFIALLGHTMTKTAHIVSDWGSHVQVAETDTTINSIDTGEDMSTGDLYFSPEYAGWSLATFTKINDDSLIFYFSSSANPIDDFNLNSIVLGIYYDMPHSPDLSLTMEREYAGIKTIETKGGASLSNSFYNKPPMWGSLGAWELYSSEWEGYVSTPANQALSRSGRRVWNLSFSYLDDGDVYGASQLLAHPSIWGNIENQGFDEEDIADDGRAIYSLLNNDNFYSQVIHKTNGGQLPFIFQPDNSNNHPDQFAICKFDQNSFRFQQTAPNLYSVSLKIREVW